MLIPDTVVDMTTVDDDFPVQQARVRQIQQHAREIGPTGQFLVAICEQALRNAETAAISGDVVRIMRAYNDLREFKGMTAAAKTRDLLHLLRSRRPAMSEAELSNAYMNRVEVIALAAVSAAAILCAFGFGPWWCV